MQKMRRMFILFSGFRTWELKQIPDQSLENVYNKSWNFQNDSGDHGNSSKKYGNLENLIQTWMQKMKKKFIQLQLELFREDRISQDHGNFQNNSGDRGVWEPLRTLSRRGCKRWKQRSSKGNVEEYLLELQRALYQTDHGNFENNSGDHGNRRKRNVGTWRTLSRLRR